MKSINEMFFPSVLKKKISIVKLRVIFINHVRRQCRMLWCKHSEKVGYFIQKSKPTESKISHIMYDFLIILTSLLILVSFLF